MIILILNKTILSLPAFWLNSGLRLHEEEPKGRNDTQPKKRFGLSTMVDPIKSVFSSMVKLNHDIFINPKPHHQIYETLVKVTTLLKL